MCSFGKWPIGWVRKLSENVVMVVAAFAIVTKATTKQQKQTMEICQKGKYDLLRLKKSFCGLPFFSRDFITFKFLTRVAVQHKF